MPISKKQERANWNDLRSKSFRSAVKGWAFTRVESLPIILKMAKVYAWLPEHFETISAIEAAIEKGES